MLSLAKVPHVVVNYTQDCYSQLHGYVHTKDWITPFSPILQGVFQGDTMSPIIFLLTISPILYLATNWAHQGFKPLIPIPDSDCLPPKDATVYILWDDPESSEPPGWYRATITDYLPDGTTLIRYPDDKSECLDLRSVHLALARKNGKRYVESKENLSNPPKAKPPVTQYASGQEHKGKAFADDMTVITKSQADHQNALQASTHAACSDLGLKLKPSKCVTIVLDKG